MMMGDEKTLEPVMEAARGYFLKPFDAIIKISLDDQLGSIWVNGHTTPPEITLIPPQSKIIDCQWVAGYQALMRLFLYEERSLAGLFIAGRLQIAGNMAVMARLNPDRSDTPQS